MKPLKAEHLCSEDFEIRLRRAREEELEIVEYYGEEKASGKIMNNGNGHSYIVSMEKCECEDFRKRRLPCKHILYFAIQTSRIEKFEKPVPNIKELRFEKSGALQIHDDFIPHYWNYFSGKISGGGIGYTNFKTYKVCGRKYGISEKTGRQTNRKKQIFVNAVNEDDAIKAAQQKEVMPPYEYIRVIDECPSDRQYAYLHGAKIPFPNLIDVEDVSALLTRFEEKDDSVCPESLFNIATYYRVKVSLFASAAHVIRSIWYAAPEEKKPEIYCYSVFCKEYNLNFGDRWTNYADGRFAEFKPGKKALEYILEIGAYELVKANKNAKAYQEARAYIEKIRLKTGY